jgi:hypothetical protein
MMSQNPCYREWTRLPRQSDKGANRSSVADKAPLDFYRRGILVLPWPMPLMGMAPALCGYCSCP